MIPGSRASGAARPLSWTATTECPVWRKEATIQAPVNATGPAIPAAAPSLDDSGEDPAVRAAAASLDGSAEGPVARTAAVSLDGSIEGPAARVAAASRDEEGMRMADSVTYRTPGSRAARLTRGGGAGGN